MNEFVKKMIEILEAEGGNVEYTEEDFNKTSLISIYNIDGSGYRNKKILFGHSGWGIMTLEDVNDFVFKFRTMKSFFPNTNRVKFILSVKKIRDSNCFRSEN